MLYKIKKNRLYINIGREKDNSEKCILPTILFINTNHQSFGELANSGFCIAIGWWDWSVKLYVFWNINSKQK